MTMSITKESDEQTAIRDQSDLGIPRRNPEKLPNRDTFAQGLDNEIHKVKIIIAYQRRRNQLWRLGILYQQPSIVINQPIYVYAHAMDILYHTKDVDTIKILQELKL